MEFADWINLAGNTFVHNWEGNIIQGGSVTNFNQYGDDPHIAYPPKAALVGPSTGIEGHEIVLDASASSDPDGNPLSFRWDLGDGTVLSAPRVAHAFKAPGYYCVGMTVNNGRFSDLGSRSFRVVDDCPELGTEGQAADWTWEEVVPRQNFYWDATRDIIPLSPVVRVAKPTSKIEFSNDADCLAGKSSVLVRYWPANNQVHVLYPKSKHAGIPLAGKTRLVFWSKLLNGGIHAWAGLHPVITLYESEQKYAVLRPSVDASQIPHGEREENGNWMYRSIPLHPAADDKGWRLEGELPVTLNYLTIEFGPSGSAELIRLWIDAMAIR